jgi:pimeloyl-ACP methyl ester carboxylesterase
LALNLALHAPRVVTHLILLSPVLPLASITFSGLVHAAAMMLMPSRWTVNRFLQQTSVRGYDVNDPYLEQRLIGNTQIRSLRHLRPRIAESEFQELSTRTLMLLGEQEIMYNAQAALKRAKQLMPHLEAEIIPSCGHALNRDQPHQIDERILEFIQR